MAPIHGISLERYADLAAELGDTTNPELEAEIVARHGVHRVDWESAKQGWTSRMADASLKGRVTSAFLPLYRAALARKSSSGAPSVSYDEFVAMSGVVEALGVDGMLAHYDVSLSVWTKIAGHWSKQVADEPAQYSGHATLVEREGTRIRQGGPPKPVSVTRGAPGPRPAASPEAPGGAGVRPGFSGRARR